MSFNSQPEFWVSKDATLPDVCIGCGMYTDRRVTRRFSTKVETTVDANSADQSTGLGCLLMMMGPLGMLISLLMNMRSNSGKAGVKVKTINLKAKIKVPICPVCESENVGIPLDVDFHSQEFAFATNTDFIRQYERLNG